MSGAAVLRSCPQVNGCPMVSARDLQRLDLAPGLRTIVLAALVSVVAHLGAMAALGTAERPETQGGGEAAPAALGTSFEDFAAGRLSPAAPDPIAPTLPAAQAAAPTAPRSSEPGANLAPAPADAALLPTPVAPEVTPPSEPTAVTPERSLHAPEASPVPPARPTPPPEPQPRQTPPQATPPQGNATRDAQRGSQQGDEGPATSSAPGHRAAPVQGSAAASNYPGEVLRVIQRTRQVRSPARGRVLVAFAVGSAGELAGASIAQSSGHAGLDRAALDHIRRAAPFPPPPPGARRQFSFEFIGR